MPARVVLRLFTHPSRLEDQHSFLVGTAQGGLTPPLSSLQIQDQTTTFKDLRSMIEFQADRSMNRRTLLFQELSFLFYSTPNPHQWPDGDLMQYRFGVYSEAEGVPRLVPEENETSVIMTEVNVYNSDLVLVPQSQIGPVCGLVCCGCDACPPVVPAVTVVDPEEENPTRVPVTNEQFQRLQRSDRDPEGVQVPVPELEEFLEAAAQVAKRQEG